MDQPITVIDCLLFGNDSENPKAPQFRNSRIEIEEEITLKPGDVLRASVFERKSQDRKGLSIQILKRGEKIDPVESSDDTPDFIKKMDEDEDNLTF